MCTECSVGCVISLHYQHSSVEALNNDHVFLFLDVLLWRDQYWNSTPELHGSLWHWVIQSLGAIHLLPESDLQWVFLLIHLRIKNTQFVEMLFLSFTPIMMLFKSGFVVDSKVKPCLPRSHFYHQATMHYLIPVSLLLIPAMDKLLVYSMEVVVSVGSLAMIL